MAATQSSVRFAAALLALLAVVGAAAAAAGEVGHKAQRWKEIAKAKLASPPYEYGNVAPLIGILSQPCRECPGK